MNNTLAEIKAALANCTKGEWIDNGNEIVSSENLNSGIGGFLTDEDNNLVVLLKNNAAALIEQLEKSQSTSAFLESRKKWEQEQESYLEKNEHDRQAISELTHKLNAVNQALTDAKGEPSETSEGLIAWLYSTLPFLEEE